LLQVESTADSRAIRAAYRKLMLLHHPDRNPRPDAQEMTQRLNHAYEILRNADRRAAYDNEPFGWVEELAPEPGPEGTGPTPGKGTFSGISRSAWLAGTSAALLIAIIVSVVVTETSSGEPADDNQPKQIAVPRPTPNITPPFIPSPTPTNNGSPTTVPIPNATAAPAAAFHLNNGAVFIESGDFK